MELAAYARITEVLTLDANYTWVDARNDAAGSRNFGRRALAFPGCPAGLSRACLSPVALGV